MNVSKPKDYRPLLGYENAKTSKGNSLGYRTGILYLAPAKEAGIGNLCPMSSAGCRKACLFTAGRGRFENVKSARIEKTLFFYRNRKAFFDSLIYDIQSLIRYCDRHGLKPAVRLNGTSDIIWEKQKHEGKTVFELFPFVQFYDYTKIYTRFYSGLLPVNYHLTFSRSEENQDACIQLMSDHPTVNIAAVFGGREIPTWYGREVIDADQHDLRFLDKPGVICGLKAKGDAKKDKSGFVIGA